MSCGHRKPTQCCGDDGTSSAERHGQKKVFRARNLIGHQSLSGESSEQCLREEYGKDGSTERCNCRPQERYPVTCCAAAVERCHALEIVVCSIGVRQEASSQDQENNDHRRVSSPRAFKAAMQSR